MTTKKKIIILSQGPVPTPEHDKVEGGGLRCWGLAKGIVSNSAADVEVTVAYEKSYAKENMTTEYEGIHLTTWDLGSVATIINQYDAVLVSYCMGDLSVRVAETIGGDRQLILDCYVPIYVEVSARESANVEDEFRAFEGDVDRWKNILRRGDYFLCASEAQKNYYKGVLSAVGRINPISYGQDMILIVPYGIYREEPIQREHPIQDMLHNKKAFKVLWFGGLYPWFDITQLLDAVKELNKTTPTELIVVGAKNPFNTHPDFIAGYRKFLDYIKTNNMEDMIINQEWIDFNSRADWYLGSDVVVVFNKEGEENKLAWRTRVVDFIWADLPIITNAGDPLGEELVLNGAAIKAHGETRAHILDALKEAAKAGKHMELKKNINIVRERYYWDKVTTELSEVIVSATRATDLRDLEMLKTHTSPVWQSSRTRQLKRVARNASKLPAYAKKHGTYATALAIKELASRKLKSSRARRSSPQKAFVVVSHQLDRSGAPLIAIDIASELKSKGLPVEFSTYLPVSKDNLTKLTKQNIRPHVLMKKDMVPSFAHGDTVILNTAAHSEATKEALFHHAEQGKIALRWYLHEDHPENWLREDEKKRIKKMLSNDRIKIFIAATQMQATYKKYFGTEKNIELLPYRHIVPKEFHNIKRPESDFSDKLTFVLPGTVGDGRKGQLPVFYAFIEFLEHYYKQSPETYRDFELVYVGLSKDFLSMQLLKHAKALKGHFKHHPNVSWEENLEIVKQGNITVCYSLSECLPLFVFEGMIAGNPILRNDSSGAEEQLIAGVNGLLLDSNDYHSLVNTIEIVLNKRKTSDKELSKMSAEAYKIAKRQESHSYLNGLESV